MAYKTILVHVNDERRAGPLIDVAVAIAERSEAHLIGLFVVPSAIIGAMPGIGGGIAFGSGLAEKERQVFRDEAWRIEQTFLAAVKGRPLVAEWRAVEVDPGQPDCAATALEHSRAVDLVVAGQTDPSWDYSLLLDFPDRLVMESGRPTLIVPHTGRYSKVGSNVLVAWNGRREASRAVFDALPLLIGAASVRVLWVDQDARSATPDKVPAAEIATALARHGVRAEAARTSLGDIDIGNALLSRVADYGADLLVMGCYGHSRLRELVLGGASRNILSQMTVPVLMSH